VTKREQYKAQAAAEREAALLAANPTEFRAHMARAREFDWLAVTEPSVEDPPQSPSARIKAPRHK
jgi:hypothetical protein